MTDDPIVKQEWLDAFWTTAAPLLPKSVSDAIHAGLSDVAPMIQNEEAKRWVRQLAEASQRILDMREELEARVLFVRGEARRAINEAEAQTRLWESRWNRAAGQRDKARAKARALDEELERERGSWAHRIMMEGLDAMASDLRTSELQDVLDRIVALADATEVEAERAGRIDPWQRTILSIRAQGIRQAAAVIEEALNREQG